MIPAKNTATTTAKSSAKNKVIVGMSGGVDSSVAALLLKQQGYDVCGLFMKNWQEDDEDSGGCSATQDINDAEKVCNLLDIPLHVVNFSLEYWEGVFQSFLEEYAKGRTPNPDVLCNREIKFNVFLRHAQSLGADYMATGHYAQKAKMEEHWGLKKASDENKDQSYFLYTLTSDILASTLFPLGNIDKPTVRFMAQQAGLENHQKKDSTGICFIGEKKFKSFLSRFIQGKTGEIKTVEGRVIGEHDGLMFYTLGQRQGLGIGGLSNTDNKPWYVVAKDIETNTLIVAEGADHPALYRQSLMAEQLHWISESTKSLFSKTHPTQIQCTAKIRYRQKDTPCIIELLDGNRGKVMFDLPQRAITPGQSIVFYDNEWCLGGGIIQ